MPTVGFTVYTGGYPRFPCRNTDKTTITTRTNTAASWQTLWDNTVLPLANTLNGLSDTAIVSSGGGPDDHVHKEFLALALAGWIENTTSYHTKLLSAAKTLAQTAAYIDSWTGRRAQLLALAYAYNFLRSGIITFSEADRKIIGDKMISYSDQTYSASDSFMDGHKGGNLMVQLIVGITLYGETGSGYNYSASALGLINGALDHWYGAGTGDKSRMETDRYFGANGGTGKGGWYTALSHWHSLFVLEAIHMGFVRNVDTPGSLNFAGDVYEPYTNEAWVGKIGEWWLNGYFRGDGDYLKIGDTARTWSNPWFNDEARLVIGLLATRGGSWRKQMAWLYNELQTKEATVTSTAAYNRVHDIVLWDPADAANTATDPEVASPAIPKTKLFDPPGELVHRNTWKKNEWCLIDVRAPEFYYGGHPHLDCGTIQIYVKGDPVLVPSGIYSTSGTEENYGGNHHRGWLQQTIAKSGAILVHDTAYETHLNRNLTGNLVTYKDGLGGQKWKEIGTTYDPADTLAMRNDASGLGWRQTGTRVAGVTSNTFRIVEEVTGYVFTHADIRRAYLKNYAEINSDADRVRECDMKLMIIKNVWQWPIVLRIMKVTSRIAPLPKREVWHTHLQPNVTRFGQTWRYSANGYRNVGKIYIDAFTGFGINEAIIGGGASDYSSYGANQFSYGGTSYNPTNSPSERHKPDVGRFRVEIKPNVARTTDLFVTALFPMLVGEDAPTYTWINDGEWLGLNFSGVEFKMALSQILASSNTDTTPPAIPTGLFGTSGPGSGEITAGCAPNTESDWLKHRFYYRLQN